MVNLKKSDVLLCNVAQEDIHKRNGREMLAKQKQLLNQSKIVFFLLGKEQKQKQKRSGSHHDPNFLFVHSSVWSPSSGLFF